MKNKLSLTSIILGTGTTIGIFIINMIIADEYLSSTGKNRAFFGLTEAIQFSYKYYLLIPATIALVLGIIACSRKENAKTAITSLILSILSIVLIFIRIWRLMV